MMAICLSAAIVDGGALGLLVFLTSPGQSLGRFRAFNLAANGLINVVRSFPFIILLVAISPFTRVIAGTSIGPLAASVPLSIAAIFYFARLIEQTLRDVPRGVIEAAEAMGASPLQIVRHVLLVEARSGLVLAVTVLAVSFLSYSAVAGVVGGGGIGDLAIRYGVVSNDVVLLSIEYTKNGDTITATQKYIIKGLYITPEQFSDWNKAVAAVSPEYKEQVVLKKK